MKYRPEIDGLRAIAVIPVILFHAGFEYFSGGFIGVDVFFVISGYLITTIILSEMEKGTFSLANFYERRVLRILPPLFFVMFVCLPFAWMWLTPSNMKDFSKSLIAVPTFVSNILFWYETGYWEENSDLKPLLHTWSLAVEEQYYIIFPLLMMILWKFSKRLILTLFLFVAFISLFVSQWGAYNHPSATFYLLPTRGWELALGGTIAFYFLYRKQREDNSLFYKLLGDVLSFLGLLMIVYAIFIFDKTIPFPSFYALIPTVGASLIILFSSPQTFVGRLLSSKFLVGIGLISYSVYLWHQPLFVFARHKSMTEPSMSLMIVLTCVSILLGYLSWRYVEQPFRQKNNLNKRKYVFMIAAVISMIFIGIGIAGIYTDGFSSRFLSQGFSLNFYKKYPFQKVYRLGDCFLSEKQKYHNFSKVCTTDYNNNTIMIWGDSHAAAFSYGLRKNFKSIIQFTASGCPPLKDVNISSRPNCRAINNYILKKIVRKKPAHLIIHANWFFYKNKKSNFFIKDVLGKLTETINYVRDNTPDTELFVVGGVPQWRPDLPTFLIKNKIKIEKNEYFINEKYFEILNIDKELRYMSKKMNIKFYSPLDTLCNGSKCLVSVGINGNRELTAWDYGHLTAMGSVYLVKKMLGTHLKNLIEQ